MKLCRDCVRFKYTGLWKGQCEKHPWKRPKYSQEAEPNGCTDYSDKYGSIEVKEG